MNTNLPKVLFDMINGAGDTEESGVPYTYNAFADDLEIGVDGEIDCQKFAGTLVKALDAAGLVIVPKVPTEKMYAAAEREWDGRMSARSRGVWQAMIAAASQDI